MPRTKKEKRGKSNTNKQNKLNLGYHEDQKWEDKRERGLRQV